MSSTESVTKPSRSQLDKLGDRLKGGNIARDDLVALSNFRNDFIASTNCVATRISENIRGFKAAISQRPAKSTPSIIAKLIRESSRLTQIQDIGGVRVVVSKVSVQNRTVALIQRLYPEARVIDRRENPQYGYRAVHVVVQEDGRYIEVQVRTVVQNTWAQVSEKFADKHGHSIKYGTGSAPVIEYLEALSNLCRPIEALEVALDGFREAEINALHKKKRSKKKMTDAENARLAEYQKARKEYRAAKNSLMKSLKEN